MFKLRKKIYESRFVENDQIKLKTTRICRNQNKVDNFFCLKRNLGKYKMYCSILFVCVFVGLGLFQLKLTG